MDALPSNVMFDIFSRLSVKSLASYRCVSKVWCKYIDDPYLGVIHGERNVVEKYTPIMFHENPDKLPPTLCFHTVGESRKHEGNNSIDYYELKDLDLKFVYKESPSEDYAIRVCLRGRCNGLLFIAQDNGIDITTIYVIHPLRKECYELPPFDLPLPRDLVRRSCGLGFDASTNTLKMVCVLRRRFVSPRYPDVVRKNLCTIVHEFGTNSWKEIPQVPFYPIQGEAVFTHGCLYWLVSYIDRQTVNEIIWFDLRKEEFGLIDPPKTKRVRATGDHLFDLNGEVGLVYNNNFTMEVWVFLKQKGWVMHCQMDLKPRLPNCHKWVLGSWNKEGDLLIKCIDARKRFFVYNLKGGVFHEVDIVGREGNYETSMVMYPNSLFSIHGIDNTNFDSLLSQPENCCL